MLRDAASSPSSAAKSTAKLSTNTPPAFLRATFWRSLQTLNASRVVIATILLIYLGTIGGKQIPEEFFFSLKLASVAYLACAIGFVVLKALYPRRFLGQLAVQVALDIFVIAGLYLSSGGAKTGLAILFLFPLAGVGILAPLLWGMFFAAVVTIFFLIESTYRTFALDDAPAISQAGLYGAAFFGVVIVLNRLAHNLVRQEELAHRRGVELMVQQSVNRLVITDMSDGVLVVDQNECLFEINPAAERMLGLPFGSLIKNASGYSRDLRPLYANAALRPIADVLRLRLSGEPGAQAEFGDTHQAWMMNEESSYVTIRNIEPLAFMTGSDHDMSQIESVIHLKLRFIPVRMAEIAGAGGDQIAYTIVFMQDVSEIESKAQQLKLASMGRLTASIAHEVRNPLSSISYAASLLSEDMSDAMQSARLLNIVHDNVDRLNKLIEDILKLSRKAQVNSEPISLMDVIEDIVRDFVETRELDPNLIYVEHKLNFQLIFDVSHLREIVCNLLSNAMRYASAKPGCIRIYAVIDAVQRHELRIQDDGPGIPKAVRAHLFEPFYTTSNKGTGLGLYMARELCANNQAVLDYSYFSDDPLAAIQAAKGCFVIHFSEVSKVL
jgi:two-component system, NtrC family, sensor histidine kinase PilS